MNYASYEYYISKYLSGNKEAVIDSASFSYYSQKASQMLYTRTLGNSEIYAESDEIKMCVCALVESLVNEHNAEMQRFKSESVGDRTVTYADSKKYVDYKREREDIYKTYLLTLGILNRRVFR